MGNSHLNNPIAQQPTKKNPEYLVLSLKTGKEFTGRFIKIYTGDKYYINNRIYLKFLSFNSWRTVFLPSDLTDGIRQEEGRI